MLPKRTVPGATAPSLATLDRLTDRAPRGYAAGAVIFAQGETADAVYVVRSGTIKLSVMSRSGKEAVIAMLGAGDFFGEGCLAGQPLRMATATALEDAETVCVLRPEMLAMLAADREFATVFTTHLLARNVRFEADLVDQLFNSSEKRLARALLLLAQFGKEGEPKAVVANLSQETLAEMIGTTRSRVSYFMNKFRRLGFIEYNGGLHVHSSLLSIVLHD